MSMNCDEPWESLRKLREQMNRTFDDYVLTGRAMPEFIRRHISFPRINLLETATEITVECDLPGVKRDSVEVSLRGRELTIHGERPEEEISGHTYLRHERGAGKLSRVVQLPVDVKAEDLQAHLKDGVLVIKLPKPPQSKPRQIKVVSPE